MERVVVDTNLANGMFTADKHSRLIFTTTTVNTTEEGDSGSDSIQRVPGKIDIMVNCKIKDSGGRHYPFDTCTSFYKNDTLVIRFQNNHSFMNTVGFGGKLIVQVIGGKFYSEYIPEKSQGYESPYLLMVDSQAITIMTSSL